MWAAVALTAQFCRRLQLSEQGRPVRAHAILIPGPKVVFRPSRASIHGPVPNRDPGRHWHQVCDSRSVSGSFRNGYQNTMRSPGQPFFKLYELIAIAIFVIGAAAVSGLGLVY